MNGRDLLYYIMEDISGIMSILLQVVDLYPGDSFDYTRSISYGVDLEGVDYLNTKSRFERNTKSRFGTMSRIKIRRDDLAQRVDLTRRVDLTLRVDFIRRVDLKESI